jgi:hypothetical protein
MELSEPGAVVDTSPILEQRPVGMASRSAGPGERKPVERLLMPLPTSQEEAKAPAANETTDAPPVAAPAKIAAASRAPDAPPVAAPASAGASRAPDPPPVAAPAKTAGASRAPDPQPVAAPAAPSFRADARGDKGASPRADARGGQVAAAVPRFHDAKCIEVVPVAWKGSRLSLQQGSATPAWLDLSQIQAIACAAVTGLAERPVVLVDLLLNWSDVTEKPLRVLRLRSDRFDPSRILPGSVGGLDGFRALLDALIERSGATPLPDERQARGRPFARFESLERYEREVLSIDR